MLIFLLGKAGHSLAKLKGLGSRTTIYWCNDTALRYYCEILIIKKIQIIHMKAMYCARLRDSYLCSAFLVDIFFTLKPFRQPFEKRLVFLLRDKFLKCYFYLYLLTLFISGRPSKPSVQTINGDFPWVEGGRGQLTCLSTTDGNPSATISWTPNVGIMNAQNQLVIDSLSYLDHKRTIKCGMENSFTEMKDEMVESEGITLNVQCKY